MNESFIKIKGRIDNKNLDELVAFLENDLYARDVYGNYVSDPYLTFLLSLDFISQKLYNKDPECGYWAIELSKYTNGETGYFDKLFESASLLIRDLIIEDQLDETNEDEKINAAEWNVILKMDTHNNPKGKSKYSLLTPNDKTIIIKDEHCKSLAYTLFFDYFDFCNYKKDAGELTDNAIYTVHKEFINEKTARSFSYEMENGTLVKRTDGIVLPESDEVKVLDDEEKLGREHYLSFIRCLLDKTFIREGASSFSDYLVDPHTDNSWDGGADPMMSFSYYNLGIQGFESWGTLMIECNDEATTVYKKFYPRGGDNEDSLLLSKIKNVISALKKIDDEYNDALNKQKIRQESIKSAKAAIMSRNMSHNIGSHVMSYLKQNLCSVQDILKNGVLSNILDGNNIFLENGEARLRSNLDKDVKDVALPFLVGMGHFISYLQERQDFIATVATDYIPYNSTINFKDDIYDILNPDKRVERHAERTTSMATDNILIGNIARSEGLGRVPKNKHKSEESFNDIVLKFRSSFDGDPVIHGTDAEKELEAMRGYDLSLPGGILGRQAFFSITENIIRNAAKHGSGQTEDSPNLEFTFDIITKQDVLDKVRTVLTSNDGANGSLSLCQVLEKFYINALDSNELYYVTITDNCDCSEESLGKLRKALLEKYIDEYNGTMNNGNKGLKEIRISAAWLRTIKNEDDCFEPKPFKKNNDHKLLAKDFEKDNLWQGLDNNSPKKAPLIYVRLSRLENDNQGLQYIICLPIPQVLAIISDSNDFVFSQDIQHYLSTYFWKVYTTTEFLKVKDKSFEFILCDGLSYNIVRPFTTSRTIQMEKSVRSKIIDVINDRKLSNGCSTIMKQLYHSFVGQSDKQIKDTILIADNGALSKTNYVRVASSAFDSEYMYRSHHETDKNFLAFMRDLRVSGRKNVRFVEGVTGNNSTDRLIRHGEIDDIWFYRHLHAMKQQIAVFDERLFSTITGREEKCFSKDEEKINTEGYKALTYIQKGIFPFTLIENDGVFKIIGCLCKRVENEKEKDVYVEHVYNNKYECECKCLAEIHYSHDGGPQIIPVLDDSNMYIKKYFHFITIHQGLLDKLYEAFNVKDCPEEKIKITSELYSYLCICNNIDDNKNVFLPGLNIHSGRSKPNKSDMPQQVPFIQYAALEHAISDCKYTLVELLDNARYED